MIVHSDWQQQRARLNHDWLKNDFLRRLRAFIDRLEDEHQDRERIAEFLDRHWPEWADKRPAVKTLLEAAEESLSPRQFFLHPPLAECSPDVKSWLPGLIHGLWLVRTDTRRQIEQANRDFVAADAEFTLLASSLTKKPCGDSNRLRKHTEAFRTFEALARALADSISAMPHKIEVV